MNDTQHNKLAAFIGEGSQNPTPELCEHLGSKAAQLAIDANLELSDAVVKVASDVSGLNNNHINNICWEANNEYFRKLAVAKKEAGESLEFNYSLADPPDVAKRLNSAALPKISFVADRDYLAPPKKEKVAEDTLLQKFFGKPRPRAQKQLEAVARAKGKNVKDLKGSDFDTFPKKYASHNAVQILGEQREILVRASTQMREKASSAQTGVEMAEAHLYKMFKQAALSGTPLGHIVDLLNHHHDGESAVVAEISKLAHKLAKEDSLFFRKFQKTAGVDPAGKADLDHPLYHAYSNLRSTRRESAYMSKAASIATAEAEFARREEGKLVAKHMQR